jgi:hypothetical protein
MGDAGDAELIVIKWIAFAVVNLSDVLFVALPLCCLNIERIVRYFDLFNSFSGGLLMGIALIDMLGDSYGTMAEGMPFFTRSNAIFLGTFLLVSFYQAYQFNRRQMHEAEQEINQNLLEHQLLFRIHLIDHRRERQYFRNFTRREAVLEKQLQTSIEGLEGEHGEHDEEDDAVFQRRRRQRQLAGAENDDNQPATSELSSEQTRAALQTLFFSMCFESFFSCAVIVFQGDAASVYNLTLAMMTGDWGECVVLGILLHRYSESANNRGHWSPLIYIVLLLASNAIGLALGFVVTQFFPGAIRDFSSVCLAALAGLYFYFAANEMILRDLFSPENTRPRFAFKTLFIFVGFVVSVGTHWL